MTKNTQKKSAQQISTKKSRHRANKCRANRQLGLNILGVKKVYKRDKTPGQHGSKRTSSDLAMYFAEVAKLKALFRIRTHTIKRILEKSLKSKNKTAKMAEMFYSRLDNIVYEAKFASTIGQACQVVSHGFVRVNDRNVNIRSYSVKIGDVVSIGDEWFNHPLCQQSIKNNERKHSPHLSITNNEVKVISLPGTDAEKYKRIFLNFNTIVESSK